VATNVSRTGRNVPDDALALPPIVPHPRVQPDHGVNPQVVPDQHDPDHYKQRNGRPTSRRHHNELLLVVIIRREETNVRDYDRHGSYHGAGDYVAPDPSTDASGGPVALQPTPDRLLRSVFRRTFSAEHHMAQFAHCRVRFSQPSFQTTSVHESYSPL
jgi:hypothetical protein